LQMAHKCLPSSGAVGQTHWSPTLHWGIVTALLSFYLCDFSKKMLSWCCPDMFMVRTECVTYDETSLSSVQSIPWTCICSWTADTVSAVHEQLVLTILTCRRQKNGYFIAKHDWMTRTGCVQPLDKTCSQGG
jgi:hypothetical protein